ncbi:MAG: hypothetical protein ABIE07_14200 [Candidatus Zixiibacteriota bacterium]
MIVEKEMDEVSIASENTIFILASIETLAALFAGEVDNIDGGVLSLDGLVASSSLLHDISKNNTGANNRKNKIDIYPCLMINNSAPNNIMPNLIESYTVAYTIAMFFY